MLIERHYWWYCKSKPIRQVFTLTWSCSLVNDTDYMLHDLLEQLTAGQETSCFHETLSFITIFPKTFLCILSWTSTIQSIPSYTISVKSILIHWRTQTAICLLVWMMLATSESHHMNKFEACNLKSRNSFYVGLSSRQSKIVLIKVNILLPYA